MDRAQTLRQNIGSLQIPAPQNTPLYAVMARDNIQSSGYVVPCPCDTCFAILEAILHFTSGHVRNAPRGGVEVTRDFRQSEVDGTTSGGLTGKTILTVRRRD